MSSLVTTSGEKLAPIVLSDQCLEQIYLLLHSEEKQIKHFAYGLLSDIGKKYNLGVHV